MICSQFHGYIALVLRDTLTVRLAHKTRMRFKHSFVGLSESTIAADRIAKSSVHCH